MPAAVGALPAAEEAVVQIQDQGPRGWARLVRPVGVPEDLEVTSWPFVSLLLSLLLPPHSQSMPCACPSRSRGLSNSQYGQAHSRGAIKDRKHELGSL
eukprot:3429757-Pyramimonas_sp.AAC.1